MSKLKAFTLIELIVGLVISSIVIVMAGTVFNITKKQFSDFKSVNDSLQESTAFEYLVKKDVDQCIYLLKNGRESMEAVYSDRRVRYRWKKEAVIREDGNAVDTFHLHLASAELYFRDNTVLPGDTLVSKVIFQYSGNEESYSLEKTYSAEQLIQTADPWQE